MKVCQGLTNFLVRVVVHKHLHFVLKLPVNLIPRLIFKHMLIKAAAVSVSMMHGLSCT